MNPELLQQIRTVSERLVAEGVSNYETRFGKIEVEEIKNASSELCLEMVLTVLDRFENKEIISIEPFKNILLDVLFKLEPDVKILGELINVVFTKVVEFIKTLPNFNANVELTKGIEEYSRLIGEYGLIFSSYLSSNGIDIIQSIQEYGNSTTASSVVPLEFDSRTRTSYVLFPKSRYWEVFTGLNENNSYSPLDYNNFVKSQGYPQYQIPISYDTLLIYNDELYKLKPDVTVPTRTSFVPEEWNVFSSKFFNKSQSFKKLYADKIQLAFRKFTESGFDINEIISDSHVKSYSTPSTPDERILASTFGGVGKELFESIRDLNAISNSFGGYEGSPVGGIEYLTQFSEYLISAAYGRQITEAYDTPGGSSSFGNFEKLFLSKASDSKMPGLKFLEGFSQLKSFKHNQKIPLDVDANSSTLAYNPLYAQFGEGIKDRFSSLREFSVYVIPPRVDLLLLSIENLYRKSLYLGDAILALLNSLNNVGKPPGYEGLGSVELQLKELQRVFPPSSYVIGISSDEKIGAGLSSAIRYLLNNYGRFSKAVINPIFPGKSLEFFGPWVNKIYNKLEEILDVIKSVGVTTSSFIPNLSFRNVQPDDSELIEFLRSIGFRDSETNILLKAQSFEELVQSFAPLSDSSDIKSFFKAYELSQLIYEFGGQEGVNAYLSFLYSNNELDSLLNILSISQKDKSKQSHVNVDKYPKLIGLLIGLTYAVDPQQISKFNSILSRNELKLLDQITFLYQGGEDSIIKSPEDIDVLMPMTSQMIAGVYQPDTFSSLDLNYSQVNSEAPIALRQWTEIIGDNLGSVDSSAIIHDLYDQSIGLTPKELFSILNVPASANKLSLVLDGVVGGSFTNFLRYAMISGLSIKLQGYKNSYQTNNFEVENLEGFYGIPSLVSSIEEVIRSVKTIGVVFSSQLDYTVNEDTSFSRALDPLIFSQNKTFESLVNVTSSIKPESSGAASLLNTNNSILLSESKSADILEAPGIGNSRIPNRVPSRNSITPEQYKALETPSQRLLELRAPVTAEQPLSQRFIKITDDNLLANTLSLTEETRALELVRSKERSFVKSSTYQTRASATASGSGSKPYKVPEMYIELEAGAEIKSQALGANYISKESQEFYSETKPFSPIESCKKFGGDNCEELYPQSSIDGRCVNSVNKSLYPESYPQVPGLSESSVPIDRPLGTFGDYKPSSQLVPTTSFAEPPSYYELLPGDATPGARSEPILSATIRDPLVPDSGAGSLSEYYNSEFGIVEFVRAKLEKSREFNCATFDSPYYYQACMNLMKCKKFSIPTSGKYFLDFCPKTFSGGRLKK